MEETPGGNQKERKQPSCIQTLGREILFFLPGSLVLVAWIKLET